jgi:hypothetical protein
VASTDPQAAYEAVYETIPAKNREAGQAFPTHRLARDPEATGHCGPNELICEVRAADRMITPPPGSRGKQYDDATAAFADFTGPA